MEPTDVRLASLYDVDNPDGPDHDSYRRLADELAPDIVVDLGCGTGILTVTLAAPNRTVTGIDPDAGMLDVARRRTGSDSVRWVLGDSSDIGDADAGLVLMTGNVAQHIGPDEWTRTLSHIAAGLRRGGTLSFDTRNPAVEAWRTWSSQKGPAVRDTPHGGLIEWMEVTEPDENATVVLTAHNLFEGDSEEIVITQPLTFRTLQQIAADLAGVGLSVRDARGGWQGEPFSDESPLLVITATKDS